MNNSVRWILGTSVIVAALYLVWKNNRNENVSGLQIEPEPPYRLPSPPSINTPEVSISTEEEIEKPKETTKPAGTGGIKPTRSSVTQQSTLVLESGTGDVIPVVTSTNTEKIDSEGFIGDGLYYFS